MVIKTVVNSQEDPRDRDKIGIRAGANREWLITIVNDRDQSVTIVNDRDVDFHDRDMIVIGSG